MFATTTPARAARPPSHSVYQSGSWTQKTTTQMKTSTASGVVISQAYSGDRRGDGRRPVIALLDHSTRRGNAQWARLVSAPDGFERPHLDGAVATVDPPVSCWPTLAAPTPPKTAASTKNQAGEAAQLPCGHLLLLE
jgi:hypothetical protein